MSRNTMSISAFSRRSLLSIKALRLYDEMGILTPARVDPSSGYRYYDESQLETARLISLLRKLGMSLADIATDIRPGYPDASALLDTWWQGEEERMSARRDLYRYIRGLMLDEEQPVSARQSPYHVAVREVPETVYLTRRQNVHGPDLPSFIGEATSQLGQRAELYGGAQGFATVVYHGVIDFDSDGPAEVCVPVRSGAIGQDGDELRTEAAHLEAATSLHRHQVAFPQILQVYRAVRQWIEANGFVISGPPRERYLEDFVEARHDELVCDVAFPVLYSQGASQ